MQGTPAQGKAEGMSPALGLSPAGGMCPGWGRLPDLGSPVLETPPVGCRLGPAPHRHRSFPAALLEAQGTVMEAAAAVRLG